MAIEAPVSKYRKNTFLTWAVVCLGFAGWLAYDGYFNKAFINKHTGKNGKPESTLVFNQKAPAFLVVVAAFLGGCMLVIKGRKIVADENGLVIAGKERIAYDSIQKIDKTYFASKGYFTITYKNTNGAEVSRKISDGDYDNLGPVLDHLVAKIS